jgi:hypothetical protein
LAKVEDHRDHYFFKAFYDPAKPEKEARMSMEKLYKQFPDVHPNIVLKMELLRQGIDITEAAEGEFKKRDDLLWKGFHLFSYDRKATKVYGEKVPAIIHLEDGCNIQVRTHPDSPYSLDFTDGEFVILENNEIIARKIWFERKPRWFDMKTRDGIQMPAIAQGFCRLIFVTMNKFCELWNSDHQCLFCDINATLTAQKKGGEDVVARLQPEVIAEVVQTALHVDNHFSWLFLTGGTILREYQGQTELEFFCTRLNAVREKLQVWIPATVQIAAYDDEGWKKIHDTGVGSIQPNIEVWDKKLFEWICPGKNKFVGYDEWIKRTIRAVDFWGRGRVNPNFVLGVEMAKPYGFKDVSSAVKSTSSGWDFLMSHGVLPRFNTWTIEPGSVFGKQGEQVPPPLEYFIEIQKAYTELRWKYKFDPPFPAMVNFFSLPHSCLHDFEFYHGSGGPLSKRYLDERLGLSPDEKGGYYDQEGYVVMKEV